MASAEEVKYLREANKQKQHLNGWLVGPEVLPKTQKNQQKQGLYVQRRAYYNPINFNNLDLGCPANQQAQKYQ